jgi:lysophospholipase L1-like esterase
VLALLAAAVLLPGCGSDEAQSGSSQLASATATAPSVEATMPSVAPASVDVAQPMDASVTSTPSPATASPEAATAGAVGPAATVTPTTLEPSVEPTTMPSPTPTASATATGAAATWSAYLALGDSVVSAWYLSSPSSESYPAVFARQLEADGANEVIDVLNLSRDGETTTSMLHGGQLDAAVQQLQTRNGNADPDDDVGLITLHIGGNDSVALLDECGDGLTAVCLSAIPGAVQTLTSNLDTILRRLRAAAGADVTLIVGTYYNPFVHPDCEQHGLAELAEMLHEGAAPLMPAGLNDLIRSAAAKHGARVAEPGALSTSQLLPDCKHPSADGHRAIADSFRAAYER